MDKDTRFFACECRWAASKRVRVRPDGITERQTDSIGGTVRWIVTDRLWVNSRRAQ